MVINYSLSVLITLIMETIIKETCSPFYLVFLQDKESHCTCILNEQACFYYNSYNANSHMELVQKMHTKDMLLIVI